MYIFLNVVIKAHLCGRSAIRYGLRARQVNVAIVQHLAVLCHLLAPSPHILHEGLLVFFAAHINWLLVLADLADLGTSNDVCESEVGLVRSLQNRALDLALKDILA